MGHEAVKDAMVAHLSDRLTTWLALSRVDGWPKDPGMVAATEVLPADEDKPWPVVMVSSTAMPNILHPGSLGEQAMICEYTLTIRVGVRGDKERDYDRATVGRDRLLLAVRWLLLAHPRLADGIVAVTKELSETTDPVAVDTKGRPVALGVLSVPVRAAETLPDPAAVDLVGDVDVTVTAVPADGDL